MPLQQVFSVRESRDGSWWVKPGYLPLGRKPKKGQYYTEAQAIQAHENRIVLPKKQRGQA